MLEPAPTTEQTSFIERLNEDFPTMRDKIVYFFVIGRLLPFILRHTVKDTIIDIWRELYPKDKNSDRVAERVDPKVLAGARFMLERSVGSPVHQGNLAIEVGEIGVRNAERDIGDNNTRVAQLQSKIPDVFPGR